MKKGNIAKDLTMLLGIFTFAIGIVVYISGMQITIDLFRRYTDDYIVFMLFCAILYLIWGESGAEKGKMSTEYADAQKKYDDSRRKVGIGETEAINRFCDHWSNADLKGRRSRVLSSANLSYEDFEQSEKTARGNLKRWAITFRHHIGEQEFERKQLRALRRCARMKKKIITAGMLLSCDEAGVDIDLTHPRVKRWRQAAVDFIPIAFSAAIGVGFGFRFMQDGFSILKLISIIFVAYMFLMSAIKGYIAGHKEVAVNTVEYRGNQVLIIEEYIRSTFRPTDAVGTHDG